MPGADKAPLMQKITLAALLLIAGIGAVMVFVQIKPFWVDEWFIMSSLKTKNSKEIFGQLNFMQQFPRVYLSLFRSFTSSFNYSYTSLRLPSYIVSLLTMVLGFRLTKKIGGDSIFARYLFILVVVSSFTFTEYYVEVKQYPMDILLSVFAIWQLIELLRIKPGNVIKPVRYIFLCITFFIVPFFSYTYPIAIAPAYAVVFLQTISLFSRTDTAKIKWRYTLLQWLPLAIGAAGIIAFYIVDARQLSTDKIMYDRWSFLMIDKDNKIYSALTSIYTMFSQTGAGLLFETIFGILGIAGLITGIVACIKKYVRKEYSTEMQLRTYACLLLLLAIVLFLFKKLPLGTPRLNAFTTPSIALLIIYLINGISLKLKGKTQGRILPIIMYAGVIGNFFTVYINYFSKPVYKRQMTTYNATQKAIQYAQDKKMPLLVSLAVAYPYERATTDAGAPDPAVWVLKTFPAYHVEEHLPVYAISDLDHVKECMAKLPADISTVVAGDGITYLVINRNGDVIQKL